MQNMTFIYIIINDTDVIIIALALFHRLRSEHIFEDLVIEFGLGKNERRISIKNLAVTWANSKSSDGFFSCFHRL